LIVVAGGYYSESFWNVPSNVNVDIGGEGKDKTFITTGVSYNNYFIEFEGVIFIYLFIFYIIILFL
jgi:hypothetical protein